MATVNCGIAAAKSVSSMGGGVLRVDAVTACQGLQGQPQPSFSFTGSNSQRRTLSTSFSDSKIALSFPERQRRKSGRFPCVVRAAIAKESVNAQTEKSAPPEKPPVQQESDIRVMKITDGVLGLRGRCSSRFKFEIEYGLKRGTTDNSYVIDGKDGFTLIDVPDEAFAEAFTGTLADNRDLKTFKSLILGHFSPKRVKSVKNLLQALPNTGSPLQIYCSNPAAQLLQKSLSEESDAKSFSVNVVRTGEELDLGEGHILRFLLTPTPRWPDGLCTYDTGTQLLFTQKIFSAHVADDNDFDFGGWDTYGEDWRFYYECMLSPTPKQIKSVLDKLNVVQRFSKPTYSGKVGIDVVKADVMYIVSSVLDALNLPITKSPLLKTSEAADALVTSGICPIHGPIVRSSITELFREYGVWTAEKLKQASEATIAVIYASAYGMTAALAQAISRGISKAGVGIETVNVEIDPTEMLTEVLQRASGFVIGSPTLGGHLPTPVQNALGVILNDLNSKSKPCGVFGSFGWSGEAVDILETRLKDTGFTLAFPSIRCKFKPTEATLQTCEESGTDIAQAVKKMKAKKRSTSAPKFSTSSSVEQAVGRVVGSLCVLSAKSGDAESSMLASWVSQASFVPPGLTVAVAKERAVEGLVLVGGKFVLNVLGQKNSGPIMKQLLKPFKPGEPRYEGLEVTPASNGGFILKDAISWMECTVKDRLETGDHWLLYATVDTGEVQDDKVLTAVHHRKSGANY